MDPNARKPGDPGTTDESGQHLTTGVIREEVSEEEPQSDYWNMTVPELRNELEIRKLSVEGNKPDLVERLEENDAARAEQE